jgi:hypothetical protein
MEQLSGAALALAKSVRLGWKGLQSDFQHTDIQHVNKCNVTLSIVTLSIMTVLLCWLSYMLSVVNEPNMLSDIMLNVVMPSVVCCVSGHWNKHSISRVPFVSYKWKKSFMTLALTSCPLDPSTLISGVSPSSLGPKATSPWWTTRASSSGSYPAFFPLTCGLYYKCVTIVIDTPSAVSKWHSKL